MSTIAVLLTCFNRKDSTLRCLSQLFSLGFKVDVYLVDDNSSDGTANLVSTQFPQVVVIQGTGDLFWSRGMHLAWHHASKDDYDFYLWLNDDVVLYHGSVNELLTCSELAGNMAVVCGIVESHDKSVTLYGGTGPTMSLLKSNGKMQAITNMNGNVVLVPKLVFDTLGNIDPIYHHDLGDVDYGFRAAENNVKVLTTRVPVASGDKNDFCRVRMWNTDLPTRLSRLYSPLGSNPNINFYFRQKHYGLMNGAIYYAYIHLINFLPDKAIEIFFGNRYR